MSGTEEFFDGSERLRKFKEDLIRIIPRIPNDRSSLQALRSKAPVDLLMVYMCWRSRSVAIRPRQVTGLRNLFKNDSRANELRPNIEALVGSVEAGEDLSPHLSRKAHRHGYVMAGDAAQTDAATWNDKDFLLNVMGLHHFHLGFRRNGAELVARSDEVLFASVTRDLFEILGLFDHSVFDFAADDNMQPEREKLWSVYDKYKAALAAPATVRIGGYGDLGITLAGPPVAVTLAAIKQVRLMTELDPQLDDAGSIGDGLPGLVISADSALEWRFKHLDFGLANTTTQEFFVLQQGPN